MPDVGLCWRCLRRARTDPAPPLYSVRSSTGSLLSGVGAGGAPIWCASREVTIPMVKATDRGCRARCAWKRQKLRVFVVLLCSCLRLSAQAGSAAVPSAEEVRQFAAEQRWQDIALLLGPLRSRSADLDFYYGTALARLERWREAESAFQAGLRLAPHDPRFPIELAGGGIQAKALSSCHSSVAASPQAGLARHLCERLSRNRLFSPGKSRSRAEILEPRCQTASCGIEGGSVAPSLPCAP